MVNPCFGDFFMFYTPLQFLPCYPAAFQLYLQAEWKTV